MDFGAPMLLFAYHLELGDLEIILYFSSEWCVVPAPVETLII